MRSPSAAGPCVGLPRQVATSPRQQFGGRVERTSVNLRGVTGPLDDRSARTLAPGAKPESRNGYTACKDGPSGLFTSADGRVTVIGTGRCEPRFVRTWPRRAAVSNLGGPPH